MTNEECDIAGTPFVIESLESAKVIEDTVQPSTDNCDRIIRRRVRASSCVAGDVDGHCRGEMEVRTSNCSLHEDISYTCSARSFRSMMKSMSRLLVLL